MIEPMRAGIEVDDVSVGMPAALAVSFKPPRTLELSLVFVPVFVVLVFVETAKAKLGPRRIKIIEARKIIFKIFDSFIFINILVEPLKYDNREMGWG